MMLMAARHTIQISSATYQYKYSRQSTMHKAQRNLAIYNSVGAEKEFMYIGLLIELPDSSGNSAI